MPYEVVNAKTDRVISKPERALDAHRAAQREAWNNRHGHRINVLSWDARIICTYQKVGSFLWIETEFRRAMVLIQADSPARQAEVLRKVSGDGASPYLLLKMENCEATDHRTAEEQCSYLLSITKGKHLGSSPLILVHLQGGQTD